MNISAAQLKRYPLTEHTLPLLHTLPAAALHRHLYRGEVIRLGAGYCLPHTAQLPLARLYSLASLLPSPRRVTLCRSTAAWVWNALSELPEQLEVNVLPPYSRLSSHTTPGSHELPVVIHYSRYHLNDLVTYQGLTLTSRFRTLLDLLYFPGRNPQTAVLGCHRLQHSLGITLPNLTATVAARRHPQKRTALQQLQALADHALHSH